MACRAALLAPLQDISLGFRYGVLRVMHLGLVPNVTSSSGNALPLFFPSFLFLFLRRQKQGGLSLLLIQKKEKAASFPRLKAKMQEDSTGKPYMPIASQDMLTQKHVPLPSPSHSLAISIGDLYVCAVFVLVFFCREES
ncbi:hypothetical protein HPP92_000321 [Vanilla planifolia]|uniref:Uncharacterized protein n=1 Tax=Vanilla planifolia TaxID=51239 RepID=A0A835S2M2_VANPL|nr:hypothetical protein HPP92_000321 [Vanilla planifolia]